MAGGPPQLNPQMMQMLAAGGAPGGGSPAASPPGAPPAAAAIGRMLQGQRQIPQGSGEMEAKTIEDCMVRIGKVLQTTMMSNPEAYQQGLKAQMALHTMVQKLKQNAQDNAQHQQMTSSIMNLLRSGPGVPGGGGPMQSGPGQQLG